MNKYIWVFGLTAVGKKTFIYDLCNLNSDNSVLSKLSVDYLNLIKIPIVVPKTQDENRMNLISSILNTNSRDFLFLIHGQYLDIKNEVLSTLKKTNKEFVKNCIYLKTDEKTYLRNRKRRNNKIDGFLYTEVNKGEIKQNKIDEMDKNFLDKLRCYFDNINIIHTKDLK